MEHFIKIRTRYFEWRCDGRVPDMEYTYNNIGMYLEFADDNGNLHQFYTKRNIGTRISIPSQYNDTVKAFIPTKI